MKRASLVGVLIVFFSLFSNAQTGFTKHTYAVHDSLELELNLFLPDTGTSDLSLLIFVHGGGFSGGHRNYGNEICRFAAENGMLALTISYTLSMKGRDFSCNGIASEKIKTIQMAAFETHLATLWAIERFEELKIDTNKIFLAGSSAGAEAALQGAFWTRNGSNFFPDTLSPTFKYAGVISGAGALIDINMINYSNKIPVMCYHGTCDPLVPYYIAPHHYCSQISSGFVMMFGGLAIHERLIELNGSTRLVSFCGEGHEHAGTPFYGPEKEAVIEFINQVNNCENFQTHNIVNNGKKCKMGLDFYFCY